MQLGGDTWEPETREPRHRHVEHVRLGRKIEEQLVRAQSGFAGQPFLDALQQIGIARGPIGRVGGKLRGWNVERALREPALA